MTKSSGILAVSFLIFFGCYTSWITPARAGSDPAIAHGQEVDVEYTCRFTPDGPVVASTSRDVISDEGYLKSSLFRAPQKPGPVTIRAGVQNATGIATKKFILNFEEYIQEALARIITGMPADSTRTVTLSIEPQTQISENERILKLATVWKRPRKVSVSREFFESRYPTVKTEKGSIVPIFQNELKCEITEVNKELVTYQCQPLKDDGSLMTAYAPASFEETDEGYDMVLHPEVGDLVRTAGMIGRITDVNSKFFTIDYTEPFGGNQLICNIAVAKPKTVVQPGKNPTQNTAQAKDGSDQKAEPKDKGTSKTESAKAPSPDTVEPDDLVMVEYTAKLKDGTLVQTTRQSIAEDKKQSRVNGFGKDNIFGPEPVIAGKEAGFKGVGTTVIGMKKGQSKQVTLAPQEAYGDIDPNKIAEVPRIRSYQKEVTYPAKDFVMQYDKFPRKDDAIDVNPYLEGTVIEVRDKDVLIKLRPKKKKFEETFGEVQVKEKGDTIEIILEPQMGADFQQDKYTGRIVSMDEDGFEVNLNHPLAGKEIVLDLSVTALTKKADIKSQELKWLEDYDTGLKLAKDKDKPMVMVLFSRTCPWCDKLLNETMTDPRITGLNNSYVWVKIDADFQKELSQKYELTSMPLTLLFDSKGDVRERVSGYLNAADLFRKLKSTYGWEVAGK